MSSSMKTKLSIVVFALVLLGGKLIADTVVTWTSGPGSLRGVVNLPAAAKQNTTRNTMAFSTFRYGFKMRTVENGLQLVLPSCMNEGVATIISGGVPIESRIITGSMSMSREDLIALRNGGVTSFFIRIQGLEGEFILSKVVLTEGQDAFAVLVQ